MSRSKRRWSPPNTKQQDEKYQDGYPFVSFGRVARHLECAYISGFRCFLGIIRVASDEVHSGPRSLPSPSLASVPDSFSGDTLIWDRKQAAGCGGRLNCPLRSEVETTANVTGSYPPPLVIPLLPKSRAGFFDAMRGIQMISRPLIFL